MKTDYKYLKFEKTPFEGKTSKWNCITKSSETILGTIKWYGAWRQYCYFPVCEAVYSAGCLKDISDFIEQLSHPRPESAVELLDPIEKIGPSPKNYND